MRQELRGFFNVCRHHASHLVEGQGNVDRLTCPYHGWCYDLDGSLRSAPHVEQVAHHFHCLLKEDLERGFAE